MINLGDMMKGMFGRQAQPRKMTVEPRGVRWSARKRTSCWTTTG